MLLLIVEPLILVDYYILFASKKANVSGNMNRPSDSDWSFFVSLVTGLILSFFFAALGYSGDTGRLVTESTGFSIFLDV
jgi:hypothetical protein